MRTRARKFMEFLIEPMRFDPEKYERLTVKPFREKGKFGLRAVHAVNKEGRISPPLAVFTHKILKLYNWATAYKASVPEKTVKISAVVDSSP